MRLIRVVSGRTSLSVLDEVADTFCSETNDGKSRRQRLEDDLSKRLRPTVNVSVSTRSGGEKGTHQLGKAKMSAEANAAANSPPCLCPINTASSP